MSEAADDFRMPPKEEFERLNRYLDAALSDPVRLSVLLAHGLIEDMIDDFIKECVPNHDSLTLSKMRFNEKFRWARALDHLGNTEAFWSFIEAFTNLRNGAAHRNWEEKREYLFAKLRESGERFKDSAAFSVHRSYYDDDKKFVRSLTVFSFGYLSALRDDNRTRSQGKRDSASPHS